MFAADHVQVLVDDFVVLKFPELRHNEHDEARTEDLDAVRDEFPRLQVSVATTPGWRKSWTQQYRKC